MCVKSAEHKSCFVVFGAILTLQKCARVSVWKNCVQPCVVISVDFDDVGRWYFAEWVPVKCVVGYVGCDLIFSAPARQVHLFDDVGGFVQRHCVFILRYDWVVGVCVVLVVYVVALFKVIVVVDVVDCLWTVHVVDVVMCVCCLC